MFSYEKKLQYPVKIATPNPKLAAMIISQYGGPNFNRLYYFLAPLTFSHSKSKYPRVSLLRTVWASLIFFRHGVSIDVNYLYFTSFYMS